jgi:hypothetical protein
MFGLGPLGSRESTCVLGMYIEVIEQDITSCKHPPHECSYQSSIESLASQGLKQIQLGANYSKFIGHSCTSPQFKLNFWILASHVKQIISKHLLSSQFCVCLCQFPLGKQAVFVLFAIDVLASSASGETADLICYLAHRQVSCLPLYLSSISTTSSSHHLHAHPPNCQCLCPRSLTAG